MFSVVYVSKENLLNYYTKSPTIETLGNSFDYQTEISHTPETQVCVELQSHNLQQHKLNSDNILTIKQCLEDGEGRFLGNNSSSDLECFYNYPICSKKFIQNKFCMNDHFLPMLKM